MPSISQRVARLGLHDVERRSPRRSCGCSSPPRRRKASDSASRMRRTSSCSCCSSATMSLLISTVLSGSRNRLAPLAELPCTMPGIAAAVFGAHDQHVAAVAIGDDLLLQVLRGVLAAQVRLERAAQARALLAQPVADAPQLRARIVDDVAAGIDLAAHVGDLALERGRGLDDRARARGKAARARRTAADGGFDRSEEVGEPEQLQRLERAAFDRERVERSPRAPPARAARSRRRPRGSARSRRSSPARPPPLPASAQRVQPGEPVRARAASARDGRRPRQCDRIRGP